MEIEALHRAERSDVADLARGLSRAFYDDPVCSSAWPDDGKRLGRCERAFAAQLRIAWTRREVYAAENFSCVAVWAPPGEWRTPTRAVPRVVASAVRTRVRMAALLAYLRTEALHPDEPHWYLELLGTVPEKQGKGLGGRVLAPVLERADAEGIPVWAWSSNRQNLAFYHRLGFDVVDELAFAAGGPLIYPIRREPRQ